MDHVLDMQCPVEFKTLPDCDCPYEHWHVGCGVCLDIHYEADGSIHLRLYDGTAEAETTLHGMTLEQARDDAFRWAAPLIGETFDHALSGNGQEG